MARLENGSTRLKISWLDQLERTFWLDQARLEFGSTRSSQMKYGLNSTRLENRNFLWPKESNFIQILAKSRTLQPNNR